MAHQYPILAIICTTILLTIRITSSHQTINTSYDYYLVNNKDKIFLGTDKTGECKPQTLPTYSDQDKFLRETMIEVGKALGLSVWKGTLPLYDRMFNAFDKFYYSTREQLKNCISSGFDEARQAAKYLEAVEHTKMMVTQYNKTMNAMDFTNPAKLEQYFEWVKCMRSWAESAVLDQEMLLELSREDDTKGEITCFILSEDLKKNVVDDLVMLREMLKMYKFQFSKLEDMLGKPVT